MKASELIAKMQAAVAEHGDMDIYAPDGNGSFEAIDHTDCDVLVDMADAGGEPDVGRAEWFKTGRRPTFRAFLVAAWTIDRS